MRNFAIFSVTVSLTVFILATKNENMVIINDCFINILMKMNHYLLQTTGITPIDQLKQGMRLELQHPISPMDVWLVKIIENVGGRLYLRFEGADSASHDFWLFYLNHRLHPIGWTKANGYRYKPPPGMYGEGYDTVRLGFGFKGFIGSTLLLAAKRLLNKRVPAYMPIHKVE